ncbi:MAG: ABC transporter ATP-binding protein, partial [Muribaculaceae bacterium]
MLQARNIHKRFGDLEVLKGIDICIPQGKVTAIVGPSGAGKTTLLQILGTLSAPEAGGSVTYDSVEVTAMNDRRLSRFRNRNIGFVFQFHQLLPEFTLLENVALPAMIAGTARKEAENKAADLLERLGLADRSGHRPDQLSGGECQRAAVARALVNNPRIILAEEPPVSLDSTNRQALH